MKKINLYLENKKEDIDTIDTGNSELISCCYFPTKSKISFFDLEDALYGHNDLDSEVKNLSKSMMELKSEKPSLSENKKIFELKV